MRVEVDPSRCQGHTLCAMIAPEIFELDDTDGHAHVAVDVVPAEYHEQVHEAVRSCPEQAIHILTTETEQ
ncbi:ferredoxin [Mycobacterium sp. GA-1841]|uniref:ferredoxin n=1 Tax=Mycobacterium sp. GA-1841 TaxID=1834154 RepID=UPI00096F95E3|nr:ferredoxin [Mycobacterium sp. GA-1841]OMC41423.1 ferredoxin [Mycobacterium sp. GA-1841]